MTSGDSLMVLFSLETTPSIWEQMERGCCFCCSIAQSCLTLWDSWTAAHQVSLSFTISQSLLKFMSFESVMLSNHLILCCPLLLLPSFLQASGSFPMSQLFISGRQSSGALLQHQSFQWILRVDFLSDWLGWVPCSPRDSWESSPAPQFNSINSLLPSLLYGPTLTSIHDYWEKKNLPKIILLLYISHPFCLSGEICLLHLPYTSHFVHKSPHITNCPS